MLLAYKAFNKDLTARLGSGEYQYKEGVWNTEKEANCVHNGIHCATNPLDVLTYYNLHDSVIYLVAADGDIDEDAVDSKVSCTRLMLLEKLSLRKYVQECLTYLVTHTECSSRYIKTDVGKAGDGFVIVRGSSPIATGNTGAVLGFIQEGEETMKLGIIEIDGKRYKSGVYYDIAGREC